MSSLSDARRLEAQPARSPVVPLSSLRYDWAAALLSIMVTGGAFLDGWAHNHDLVDNTFFTPWHAVLYGGVFGYLLFLVITQLRSMLRGASWRHALPAGYSLSLVGAFLFLLGGGFDFLWHELFGFEVNLEQLMSPSHLFLVASTVFMVSGPLRAAWARRQAQPGSRWKAVGPALLSLTAVFSILTFITQFAHPLTNTYARSPSMANQALGVTSILLQAALLAGFLLFAALLWKLPFGAFTLLIILNALMMTAQNDHYELLPAAFAGGLLADLLYRWLKPGLDRPWQTCLFGFAVPAGFYGLYFWALQQSVGIGWSMPVWLGSIFLAGGLGGLLAYLCVSLMRMAREAALSSR